MLHQLIIRFCKDQKLLQILSKIEFGVAIFCRKLANTAIEENKYNLAKLLLDHAEEEEHHGKMLASLANGSYRPILNGTGAFLSIFRGSEDICKNRSFPIDSPLTLVWDSSKFPGEQLTGIFENFDGLSKRYLSLRLFFANCHAYDHDWGDRLAFMRVLEGETCKFYEALANSNCSDALKAIASKIAQEEKGHQNYLSSLLYCFPDADIKKWEDRLFWAKFGLIIDLVWLSMTVKLKTFGNKYSKSA